MAKIEEKSTIRLPPDDDPLNHHVERTNFISYCQIHFDLQEHPSTIGHSWEILNGKCRPVHNKKTNILKSINYR